MAKDIKDLIASKHSDGSKDRSDVPPTPGDVRLTIKHASDSVEYNLPHAVDHLEELLSKLKRLCAYDEPRCKRLAKQVVKKIQPIIDEVKSHE